MIKSLINLSSFVRNENEKWKFSTWSKITQKAINYKYKSYLLSFIIIIQYLIQPLLSDKSRM